MRHALVALEKVCEEAIPAWREMFRHHRVHFEYNDAGHQTNEQRVAHVAEEIESRRWHF